MDGGSRHCTGASDQNHPQGGKKIQRAKWLSEEALKYLRKEKLKAKERRKDIPICTQSSKELHIRKPFPVISAKK